MGELLASLYDKVFLFNYTSNTYTTLYVKGEHADLLPGSGSVSEDFVKILSQYIHPDYMDMHNNKIHIHLYQRLIRHNHMTPAV